MAKINQDEVFASNRDITNIFWIVFVGIIFIAVSIGSLLVYFITQPIEQLTRQVKTISDNPSVEPNIQLNSIHGSLQLLARQSLPLQATNLIKTAQFSMESLLGIINDVLDFSKIEDNSIALESTAINMTQLVHQLIS